MQQSRAVTRAGGRIRPRWDGWAGAGWTMCAVYHAGPGAVSRPPSPHATGRCGRTNQPWPATGAFEDVVHRAVAGRRGASLRDFESPRGSARPGARHRRAQRLLAELGALIGGRMRLGCPCRRPRSDRRVGQVHRPRPIRRRAAGRTRPGSLTLLLQPAARGTGATAPPAGESAAARRHSPARASSLCPRPDGPPGLAAAWPPWCDRSP